MSYKRYPVFLDLRDKHILVIGAGPIALQKVKQLLSTDAHIHIIAKDISAEIYELQKCYSKLQINKREIAEEDIRNIDLLIVATSNTILNRKVTAIARERHIWVNSVDDVQNCDFFTSSTVDYGDVRIAISSDGTFPGLTRALRRLLQDILPQNDLPLLQALGKAREAFKTRVPNFQKRTIILRKILRDIEDQYFNRESIVGEQK